MNQQTLQKIYKEYQTEEYYGRYFNQLKLREDSRQFSQIRDLKITIRNNTVAVSKGQTIVICQINTQVQKLIFNSVDRSYGKSLLNINVKFPSFKTFSSRQNKLSNSVQQFIKTKISWPQIENQLIIKETGNKFYGHTGQIQVRIVSNDGALNQTCFLAVQLLLWTCKFKRIDFETGQLKTQQYMLQIPYFYYPCKYSEIKDQILVDPSLSEQEKSSYLLSLMGDLLSQRIEEDLILIQKVRRGNESVCEQIVKGIKDMWKVEMSKLAFDIKQIRRRVNDPENGSQTLDLLVSQ